MSPLLRYGLGAVRMLLAEPNPAVRTSLRTSLFRYNLHGIDDCATAARTRELLGNRIYDIGILDADLEDADVPGIVRHVRERKLGKDPFLSVILIADPPHADRARHLINAGADAVLVRPISIQTLHSRISLLIEQRRPFVVTHDYIGPKRRTELRAESMEIPEIAAPSSLSQRAFGKTDDDLHFKAVEDCWTLIHRNRVHLLIYQLGWLIKRIPTGSSPEAFQPEPERVLRRLGVVAETLLAWVGETANPEIHAIATRLGEKAQQLAHTKGSLDPTLTQALADDVKALDARWNAKPKASQSEN